MQRKAMFIKMLKYTFAFLLPALALLLGYQLLTGIHAADNVKPESKIGEKIVEISQKVQSRPVGTIPVLTYHHIVKEGELGLFQNNNSVISEQQFKQQMKYLYDHGFWTISTSDLYECLVKKKSVPAKSVVITFDDGYQSNNIYAYPILKQYGFRATVFVISSMIQDLPQVFNPPRLTFLSLDEIKKSRDVFEFQSHSHALHFLDKDNKSYVVIKPRKQVENDLLLSKKLLSADFISYPYGQNNQQTIEILKALGYKMAFTNYPAYVTSSTNLFKLPRFSVSPQTTMEEFQRIVDSETLPLL